MLEISYHHKLGYTTCLRIMEWPPDLPSYWSREGRRIIQGLKETNSTILLRFERICDAEILSNIVRLASG